jgi:hypothetical protein
MGWEVKASQTATIVDRKIEGKAGLTIAGDELHGLELCLFRHVV